MKRAMLSLATVAMVGLVVVAQFPGGFGPGGFGPGGFGQGGPGGRGGGPGGPNRETRKIVKQFDANGNGWLEDEERSEARKSLASNPSNNRGRGGPGGFFGGGPPGRSATTGKPGPQVSPTEVTQHPDAKLYDTNVMRTLFLEFTNDDWEVELEDFHGTDVEVPATLTVDGETYPNVGVRFRGASSYGHVSRGSKRSFNVSLDMADEEQRLDGYKTLNLLNSHGDPSMMSTVVYSHVASQYIPTPKANFVQVVVNGESWGSYVNVQQFDKTFLKENFESSKGTRWKVNGSPNGDGGLRYLGDNIEDYQSRFEMKSNDGEKAWRALIELCKTLNETPSDELQAALEPILDIDGVLKFLALDVALVNSDGYWTRASDYSLFRDRDGQFHIIPHDMNEAFAMARRGGGGGPGRGGPGGPGGFGPPRGFGPPGGFGDFFGFGPPPNRGEEGPPAGAGRPNDRPEGRGDFRRGRPEEQRAGDRNQEGRGRFSERGRRGPGGGGPGGGGPGGGGRGGMGHGGVDLDPLVGLDQDRMPLRSKLLAIPELRQRYLAYVRQIADESLNWEKLGPVVEAHRDLIQPVVREDTRMLDTFEAFVQATSSETDGNGMSMKKFATQRRDYLLTKTQPTDQL